MDKINAVPADDTALVRAAQRGDISAFDALVRQHTGMVFAVAYARCSDRDAAEDLVQEVFLRAFTNLRALTQPRYFSTWLTRIARNLATDWQRTGQRRSRAIALLPLEELGDMQDPRTIDTALHLEARQREQALAYSLASLSPEQREIVLLHYAEEWSLTDISRKLNIHRTTVSRHLGQALDKLRADIAPLLSQTCKAARSRGGLPAKAAAAVAAFQLLPQVSQAHVAAQLIATVPATGAGAKSSAGIASLFKIGSVAVAAGGKAIVTKTSATTIAVVIGLAGAGYYAKVKLNPYYSNPASAAVDLPLQQLNKLEASVSAGSVSITPAKSNTHAMRTSRGTWIGTSVDLQNAITNTYEGFGSDRIEFLNVDPNSRPMDIVMKAPAGKPEELRAMAEREIPKAYGVKVRRETREMDVLILRAPKGQGKLKSVSRSGGAQVNGKQVVFSAMPMQGIVRTLGGNMSIPIVDETGLTGKYDATLTANLRDKNAVIQAVRDQLGLELVPQRKQTEMLIVDKAA